MSPLDPATAGRRPPLPIAAAGLGLRRSLIPDLLDAPRGDFDFLECAPENWIHVGGADGEILQALASRHPLVCHGLSMSLGSTAPLDRQLLGQVDAFLRRHAVELYSEHLSFCSSDDGHLYGLLPLPFTEEAVRHTAARIRLVQDLLGRRIAVENISYYVLAEGDMDEAAFTCAVLAEADCDLLLDVNNVFVNACNHGYDPFAFIDAMPAPRVAYLHVAGHQALPSGLRIDTHGSAVCADVWALLGHAFARVGVRPTLLERDTGFPPYAELAAELRTLRALQRDGGKGVAHG